MSSSSNEIYAVLSVNNPVTSPLRLVNGKATLFAAGLYDNIAGQYAPLSAEVALQIRPYRNFNGEPWASNDEGWFTESTQTANGFSGTIYLGGEWQVRASISGIWGFSMQAGVALGTSVESK